MHASRASMRPPVLPSGNAVDVLVPEVVIRVASMRPPVLPSGNLVQQGPFAALLDLLQ